MSIDPKLLEFCATFRQKEIVQAIIDHGSHRKAADALNIARGTISNALVGVKRHAERRGYSPEHDLTHVIPETMSLKGTSTLYHQEKGKVLQWVKTKADEEAQAKIILEGIKDALEEYRGRSDYVESMGYHTDDVLHTLVMGDPHFGMLSHQDETKIADFDSEIAYQIMQGAVDYLVQAAPPSKEALFVNVGDALHTDDSTNRTRRSGAQLDVDSRYYRIIKVFVWSMIHAIERLLKKHHTVTVINAAGNHDPDSTHWIQLSLGLYFDNNPRVNVISDAGHYQKYVFGDVLLGVTHGDGAKMEDLPGIMAHLWAQDWGQSKHRHWLTGHIHHKVVKEFTGCKVESFNSMAPSDSWHARSGYYAAREMHSLMFHKQHGLIARNICPVGLAHN